MDVTIDTLRDLESREQYGALVYLKRVAIVKGITETDYRVLTSALSDAGLPDYGDILYGESNLFLTSRSVRVIKDSPSTCEVELVYEHLNNPGQNLTSPMWGASLMRSRNSLQDITSEVDANGDQITVSHKFPDTDPDHPAETITQGGSVTYLMPMEMIEVEGLYETAYPHYLTQRMIGHVNASSWMGGAARNWLCTAADWTIWDIGNHRNKFRFEFVHNKDGWDPDVIFTDERTGHPPPDVNETPGVVGMKTVQMYPECNFTAYISLLG